MDDDGMRGMRQETVLRRSGGSYGGIGWYELSSELYGTVPGDCDGELPDGWI